MQRRKQGMSSFGAKVNPVGGVTADFGLGYPYYFTARLTVGAFNLKPLGFDLGVEFQTFFDIYDLSLHARWQFLEAGPLSAALRGNVGGGTGIDGRDTYFLDLTAIASLAFSEVATFSATIRYSAWTDRFCPTSVQIQNGVTPEPYCKDPTTWDPANSQAIFYKDPNQYRFSGSRFYAGLAAVAAIDRYTSVFLQLEFLPFPSELSYTQRLSFEDKVNGAMLGKDPFVYGMGGFELKF
jgi:hypothetical protein